MALAKYTEDNTEAMEERIWAMYAARKERSEERRRNKKAAIKQTYKH